MSTYIFSDPHFHHENSIDDARYINVCAEMINYTPVEFSKLITL